MKRLLTAAAALVCAIAASTACAQSVPAGFLTLTSSALVNSSGVSVTNATACAQINASSVPVGAHVTSGKTVVKTKVCANVTAGAFSLVLPDTNLTRPIHIKYALVVTDNTSGRVLLDVGFGELQPSSVTSSADSGYGWCTTSGGTTTCNLDNYTPNLPALAVVQTGPAGPKGDTGATGPTGASGSVIVNAVSGSNANILAGTIIDAIGASQICGYGSGIGWPDYMVQTNDYFAGRVTYNHYCAVGATPTDEVTQYNNNVKTHCLAHAGTATPTWVIIESGVGEFTTELAQYNKYAAMWAQAKSDGCKVIATTVADYWGTPPQAMNAMIRAGSNVTGALGGVSVLPLPYDVLLDSYSAVPYDGCTNATDGSCPVNAIGSFADGGHFNQRGAMAMARYAANVLINRAAEVPHVVSLNLSNWQAASRYNVGATPLAPQSGHDLSVGDYTATGGNFGFAINLGNNANLQNGLQFTVRNRGTGIANPAANPAFGDAYFEESGDYGNSGIGPFLFPGESATWMFNKPTSGTGTFVRTNYWSKYPANQFNPFKVCAASSAGSQVLGYCDFFDTAGFSIYLDHGPNGPTFNQQNPYHRVLFRNSSATDSSFTAALPLNGVSAIGAFVLKAGQWAEGIYINDSTGWLFTVFGGNGVTVSGTSCTVKAIVNGLITSATCP